MAVTAQINERASLSGQLGNRNGLDGELRGLVGIVEVEGGVNEEDVYTGEYEVTPKAEEDQTLPTAQKFLTKDVTVRKIQYYEMDNDAGGKTIYIGTDADLIVE